MTEQIAKIRKKIWIPIMSPQFNNIQIGETLVYDGEQTIGKTMKQSLMNLTNDMKRQNISVSFRVTSFENNAAVTTVIGYEVVPSSVKRLVRRNSEKIDMSFVCDTTDKVFIRIKPIVLARASVKGSVASIMRHTIENHISKAVKKMKFEDVMADVISHKMQSELREILNKIYPVKVCEIRYVGIEDVERPKVAEAETQAAA